MTLQESYAKGFCKVAEAYGVDPAQLYKYAKEKEKDHLLGAALGIPAGGLIGGGAGAATGAVLANTGGESLKDLIADTNKKIAPHVMARNGVMPKDFKKAKKLLSLARKGSKLSALKLALLKSKFPATVYAIPGAALGLLGGGALGGIIGKEKKS